MKNVLVLVGSNNDINDSKKNEPKEFALTLDDTVNAINESNPDEQIDYYLDSCSADRTPFLLPTIINEKRFDGIIYAGSYALVLGAAIQEVLSHLRSSRQIKDPREELQAFMQQTDRDKLYLPRQFDSEVVGIIDSKYFRDTGFIPTIGVPGKDRPSQGVTALTSIAENPSGCEPRPVVGLDRVDTALRAMHKMMYISFGLVSVVYQASVEEGAESLVKRLTGFGLDAAKVSKHKAEVINGTYQRFGDGEIVIMLGKSGLSLEEMDGRTNFMINCHEKMDMSGKWKDYFKCLTRLDHTASVGVGNYDNAAVLAAQLLNQPEVTAKMWQYRNGKTYSGVVNKPSWLVDGKIGGK